MKVEHLRGPASRTSRGKALAWAVGLSVLVLLVAGCGGSTSTTATTSVGESGGASGENASVFEPPPSPLMVFFGFDASRDSQQATYRARERERQDWITQCMAGEGFTYRYLEERSFAVFEGPGAGEPEWGSREYAEKYGLGISTRSFDQDWLPDGLIGNATESSEAMEEHRDPNGDYVESLSEIEREAFYAALYGTDNGYEWDSTVTDAENESAMENFFENEYVPTGCEALSQEEINSEDPSQAMWETFGDELSSMYDRVVADPEMVEARAEIAACVNEQDGAFSGEEQMYEDFNRRMEPIYETMTWPGAGLSEDDVSEMSDAERDEMSDQAPTLSAEGVALLTELQAEEIALGIALYDCGNAELAELRYRIQSRLEQEFISANRAELEAIKNG